MSIGLGVDHSTDQKRKPPSPRTWRVLVLIIAAGLVAAAVATVTVDFMASARTAEASGEIQEIEPFAVPPLVTVARAKSSAVRLSVRADGVIAPERESQLSALVPGNVVEIAPQLRVGSFFRGGDVLARVDDRDYKLALTRASLALEQAQIQLRIEEQSAAVARTEWALVGEGEPSELAMREPQLARAKAEISTAKAAVEQARINLERTAVLAPYSGRVRKKLVDVGQYVQPGVPLAVVYSTDVVEARLAVPDFEMPILALPSGVHSTTGPSVVLLASYGQREYKWTGRIVRTEGETDTRTGVVQVIAAVHNPYVPRWGNAGAPLTIGTFVQAEIEGPEVQVILVPVSALRNDSEIFVVGSDLLLERRQVEVLRIQDNMALIRNGLSDGEIVCVSVPDPAINGMKVRIADL